LLGNSLVVEKRAMLTFFDFLSEASSAEHLSGLSSIKYPFIVSWIAYCAKNDLFDELQKLLVPLRSISTKRFLFQTILVELSTSADPRNYEPFLKQLFSVSESGYDVMTDTETQLVAADCDTLNLRFMKLLDSDPSVTNNHNVHFPLSSEVAFSCTAASFCSSILSFALTMEACGQAFYSLEFVDLCLTIIPEEFYISETDRGTNREMLPDRNTSGVQGKMEIVVSPSDDAVTADTLYLAIQELFVHLSHFCHFISIESSEISSAFSFSRWVSMAKEEKIAYHLRIFMSNVSCKNISSSSKHLDELIKKSFTECFDSELSLNSFVDRKTFQQIIRANLPVCVSHTDYSEEEKQASTLIIHGHNRFGKDIQNEKSTEVCVLESLVSSMKPFDFGQFHLVSAFISSFFDNISASLSNKELVKSEDYWDEDGLSDLASEISQEENSEKINFSVLFFLKLLLVSVVKFNDIDSGLSIIIETLEKIFQSTEISSHRFSLLPKTNSFNGDETVAKLVLELYELESICTMAKIIKSYSSVPPLSVIALSFVVKHTFPQGPDADADHEKQSPGRLSSNFREQKMNQHLFKKQLLCSCQSFVDEVVYSLTFLQLSTSSLPPSDNSTSFLRFDLLSCSVVEILLFNMTKGFSYELEEEKSRFFHQQQSASPVRGSTPVQSSESFSNVSLSSTNYADSQQLKDQKRHQLQRFQRRQLERTSDFLSDFFQLLGCHFFDDELSRRFKNKKNDWLIMLLLHFLSFVLKGFAFNSLSLSLHEQEDLEKEFKELVSFLIFECSLPDFPRHEDDMENLESKRVRSWQEISMASSARDIALKVVSYFSDACSKSHIISFVLSSVILRGFTLRTPDSPTVFNVDSHWTKQAHYYLDLLGVAGIPPSCVSLGSFVDKCKSVLQLIDFSEKRKITLKRTKNQTSSLSYVQAMADDILSGFNQLKSLSKAKIDFFHAIVHLKIRSESTISDEPLHLHSAPVGEEFLKLLIDFNELMGFVSFLNSTTGFKMDGYENKDEKVRKSCISTVFLSSAEKHAVFRSFFEKLFRISLNMRDLPTAYQFCLYYINHGSNRIMTEEVLSNESEFSSTAESAKPHLLVDEEDESILKLVIAFLKIIRDNPHFKKEFQLVVSSALQNLNPVDLFFFNQQLSEFSKHNDLVNHNVIINNMESLLSSLTSFSLDVSSFVLSPSLSLVEDELYLSLKSVPNQEFVKDFLENYLNNINGEIGLMSSARGVYFKDISSEFPSTSSSFNEILVNKLVKSGFSISGAKKSVYETRSTGTFEAALQYAVTHSNESNFDCPIVLSTNDEELLLNQERKNERLVVIQKRKIYTILEAVWLRLFPSIRLPVSSIHARPQVKDAASRKEKNVAAGRTNNKSKPKVVRLTMEKEEQKEESLISFGIEDQAGSKDPAEVSEDGGPSSVKGIGTKPFVENKEQAEDTASVDLLSIPGVKESQTPSMMIDPPLSLQLKDEEDETSVLKKCSSSKNAIASESTMPEIQKPAVKDLLSLKFLEVYLRLSEFSSFSLSREEFLEFIFPTSISESDRSSASVIVHDDIIMNCSFCANWFVKIIISQYDEGFDFLILDLLPSLFQLMTGHGSSLQLMTLFFSSLTGEMIKSIDEPSIRLFLKEDLLSIQSSTTTPLSSERFKDNNSSCVSSAIAVSAFIRCYSLLSAYLGEIKWDNPISKRLRSIIVSQIPVSYYHLLCWFYDTCETRSREKLHILNRLTFLKNETLLLIESIEGHEENISSFNTVDSSRIFNMIVHSIRKQNDSKEAVNDSVIEDIGESTRAELIIKWKKFLSAELQLLKRAEKFQETFREDVSWKSFLQSGLFSRCPLLSHCARSLTDHLIPLRYLRVSSEDLAAKTKVTEALMESFFIPLCRLPVASLSVFHRYYGKYVSLSISDISFFSLLSKLFSCLSSEARNSIELSGFLQQVFSCYQEEMIFENHLKLISCLIAEFPVDIYSVEPGLCYCSENLDNLSNLTSKATTAILFPTFLKDLFLNAFSASSFTTPPTAKRTFLLALLEVVLPSSSSQSRKGKKAKVIKISDDMSAESDSVSSPVTTIFPSCRSSSRLNLPSLINSILLPYLNIKQLLDSFQSLASDRKGTEAWTSSDFTAFLRRFFQFVLESSSAASHFLNHFHEVFFGVVYLSVSSSVLKNFSFLENSSGGSSVALLLATVDFFRSCHTFCFSPSTSAFPSQDTLYLSVFTSVEKDFFSSLVSLSTSYPSPHLFQIVLYEETIKKVFENCNKVKLIFGHAFELFHRDNEDDRYQQKSSFVWRDMVSLFMSDTALFLVEKPIAMEELRKNREILSSSSFSTWFHSLKAHSDGETWKSVLVNRVENVYLEIASLSPVIVALVFLEFLSLAVFQTVEGSQVIGRFDVLKILPSQLNSLSSLNYFCLLFLSDVDFFSEFLLSLQVPRASSPIESSSSVSSSSNLFDVVFADDPLHSSVVTEVALIEKILSAYSLFLEKHQPVTTNVDIELLLYGLRFYLIMPSTVSVSSASTCLGVGNFRSYLSSGISFTSSDGSSYDFSPSVYRSFRCFLNVAIHFHHWSLLIDLLVIDFPFIKLSSRASDEEEDAWLSMLESEIEKEKERVSQLGDISMQCDLVTFSCTFPFVTSHVFSDIAFD
jgi:hypothetical protein